MPIDAQRLDTRDLRGLDLSDHDLSGMDLSDCDLTGATLARADLSGAVLFRACLDDACFTGARLAGTDLREARGVRVSFGGADLTGADLTAAELPGAGFSRACLQRASLVGARLTEARLVHSDLSQADLHRSQLDHATIAQCSARGSSFRDANLRGSRIAHVRHFATADWVGADLRDADTCGAYDLRRFAHDQNYLDEFYARGPWNRFVYALWWVTSDCGRSIGRWAAWVGVLALGYAALYTRLPIDFGDHETALSPLYFSVVTLTSLGYGDAVPTDLAGQVAVMSEVLCGYAMLGGLLAILSNKMARRAD